MRFSPILLLLFALAACNPDPKPGPRLDLVGSTRFLSADRASTTPADTFTTRFYAEMRGRDAASLKALRVRVRYTPTRNPIDYPTPYDADRAPQDPGPLTYLDSLLPAGQREAAFQFTANTRTTSGVEQWVFEAEDTDGNVTQRTFRLRLRNADSTLVYHRYTLRVSAPTGPGARSYVALLPGLALPPYALRNRPDNQALIDVAYVPLASNAPSLAVPTDPLAQLGNWANRRATQLRRTTLNEEAFNSADTAGELQAAFTNGTDFATATNTGPLVRNQVVAFRTADNKTGLLFIQEFPTAPTAAILMRVRITK